MPDYLETYENKKTDGELPRFRVFFRVAGLPYEIAEHDVISVVSELVRTGAMSITVERIIVDENEKKPEPVETFNDVEPETPELVDA